MKQIFLFSALFLFIATALADSTKYYVYCANGRIEVDSRNPEQMKSARGSDVCSFGEFNYLSDAEALARKQFGGVGAACSCRG